MTAPFNDQHPAYVEAVRRIAATLLAEDEDPIMLAKAEGVLVGMATMLRPDIVSGQVIVPPGDQVQVMAQKTIDDLTRAMEKITGVTLEELLEAASAEGEATEPVVAPGGSEGQGAAGPGVPG